jgi:16S rRNA (uracil1498-N3)-methyltransferase
LPGGPGERFTIRGADARHLAVVRRAAAGDRIAVSDGRGRLVEARLAAVGAARIDAVALGERHVPRPVPRVEVFQGLAKGAKVDQVVRQLVELGVDAVSVFHAGRSVARWDAARAASAGDRWASVALEAAKQSHRAWRPEVTGPLDLEAAASRAAGAGTGLVAQPGAPIPVRAALDALEDPGGGRPALAGLWLVIGPEGGLAPGEVSAFYASGARPVSFGDQILRTETASVVLASLVLYRLGRFGG